MNTQPNDSVIAYIKATTAFGGDRYWEFSRYFTAEGAEQLNGWITTQPGVKDIVLWRGYSFNERYWEDGMVESGSMIGVDQMTQAIELPAFTESPIRATLYMNDFGDVNIDGRVKVLFEIQTSGKYFVDLSQYSIYPQEKEYRCKPATKLLVTEVKQKGGYIHVKCKEV